MVITVANIIKQVRWCIDEEAVNIASLAGIDENDDAYMDNIIRSKVYDAMRWCLQYAPVDLLSSDGSSAGTNPTLVTSSDLTIGSGSVTAGNPTVVTLPSGFQRLVRVRLNGWKKAVRVPIEEDSDKYIELSDDTATATQNRPVAAIIRTDPLKLELWPGGSTGNIIQISYVNYPDFGTESITASDDATTTLYIPDKLRSAYLYYIAFLVMAAYGDNRASVMLSIAKMNLGLTE